MSSSRDAFLERVRQAVRAGNRGAVRPLEPRGQTGYQGAGPDPVARFQAECVAAGGQVHVVADAAAAIATVLDLLQQRKARKVLVGRGAILDPLDLPQKLARQSIEAVRIDSLSAEPDREPLFAAEIGISQVDYLIAETGTVVLRTRLGEPRSLSLLPPVHIAIANRSQLLPDLFDLFARLDPAATPPADPPSCLTLLTGPSKTGDIELRLVTGVHGPGEIHVVLILENRSP
jgi:L-lactate dehydrogenase complex protein LldG